ncbi:Replication protein A 70 kDa DNA-binding subunit A [Bienertia sinuspersici]
MQISDLQPTKEGGPMTVRVTRIWDVLYNTSPEPSSLDMILLDKEGHTIQATVKKSLIQVFRGELSEGKVYTINHYEVAKHDRNHCAVRNELMIRFTPFTTTLEENENNDEIPRYKFELLPLARLEERNNKRDYLIDVIGIITGVAEKGNVKVQGQDTGIRRLRIEDERSNKVDITLWRQATNLIRKYQLNSTNATKIYFNLQIPEAEVFGQT